jgi:hypothetical protein
MLMGLQPGDQVVGVSQVRARPAPKRKNVSTLRSLIGLAILGTVIYIGYKISNGSSVKTAVSGPEKIFDETVRLDEGDARSYSFTVSSSRRIHVSLHASPKRVNVILMTASDFDEYKRARGKLFGGGYHYLRAISAKGVLDAEQEDVLPSGTYHVIVERPRDSIVLTDATSAHVVIMGM